MFRKVTRSYRLAESACDRVANQIDLALQEMGLETRVSKSRISASRYVDVFIDDDADEHVTVRVSDHMNQGSLNHFEVACDQRALREFVGDHWTWPIIALADRFGIEPPARVRRMADRVGSVAAAEARCQEDARLRAFAAEMRRRDTEIVAEMRARKAA